MKSNASQMRIETRFGSRSAADVWDAEFRWRERGRLRDITVDDTWCRVAEAVATNGGGVEADARARAYAQAFARWQLLPAAELLATAGTRSLLPCVREPHVVLNCAAFVTGGMSNEAKVDWPGFDQAARLALWLLDDAAGSDDAAPGKAWVGLIGIGAALAGLDIAYDTAEARSLAARFAICLSVACAEASTLLAVERGAGRPVAQATLERWRSLGVTADWLATAERQGLRHGVSTRISRVPVLARLADTTDVLDPPGNWRAGGETDARGLAQAAAAMRGAVQPWIDDPIEPVPQ